MSPSPPLPISSEINHSSGLSWRERIYLGTYTSFSLCLSKDWEYLLNSDYHRNLESHPLARALRLDPLETSFPKDDFSPSLSLDSSTLLFTHIPAIFFVLHLIYEELKLNSLMGEGIRSLVVLLVQLARYFQ